MSKLCAYAVAMLREEENGQAAVPQRELVGRDIELH
jgi:hypothetical protein